MMKLSGISWIIVKWFYTVFKRCTLRLVSISTIITSFYYFLFSRTYVYEQRAVLAGLIRHLDDLKNDPSLFVLRRNIHRIEKGLVMPKRKPIFAREYIGETVDFYKQCLMKYSSDEIPLEIIWSRDVLIAYFHVENGDPLISKAKKLFYSIEKENAPKLVPRKRSQITCDKAHSYLQELAIQRKSVRTFLQKPVPRELIDKALRIAEKAPTSCNRQPTVYRIFDDPELVKEISLLPLGAKHFADNIPVICAVTGDLSAYFYERDRHSIYIDGSLSAMMFMLALETVGLSSCALNWAEINSLDRKFEKRIGLPAHERVIMFMAIGYPDPEGKVAYSEKKGFDLLRSYNKIEK